MLKTLANFGFLALVGVTEPVWAMVGRPWGNARNAARTNAVAISSLKHLNGVPVGSATAWLDQGGAH